MLPVPLGTVLGLSESLSTPPGVLIGVDWGGTKIEAAALAPDGTELVRVRTDTPRSDYEACLATIVRLVAEVEESIGTTGLVGVGLPGSLDPRTGVPKDCSSTRLTGRHPRGRPAHRAGPRPADRERRRLLRPPPRRSTGPGSATGPSSP